MLSYKRFNLKDICFILRVNIHIFANYKHSLKNNLKNESYAT